MSLSPLQSPIPLLIPPPGETLPHPQFDTDTSRNTSSSERKPTSLRERRKKSTKELANLFEQEAREALHLQRVLVTLTEQLKIERNRADEAERKVQEVLIQLRTVNDAKNAAVREATSAHESLELYKRRLEQAQNEIYRAQEVLKVVDMQRHEAEKMAAKDRSTAHKLREQNLVFLAREEGRKIGLKEGFSRGRDMGFHEGYTRGQSTRRYEDEEDESYYDDSGDTGTISPLSDSDDVPTPPPPPPREPPRRAPSEPPTPIPPPPPSTSGGRRRTEVPPDGIPLSDRNSYIHLPPPHELSRPPTMHGTPRDDPPLHVPAPSSARSRRSMRSMRSLDHIRRSSPESNSTSFSQFEMVNAPTGHSPMSIIPEVLSANASPNPHPDASISPPTIAVTQAGPSPRTAMANLEALEALATKGVYTRTRSSSSSSDSSKHSRPPSARRQSQGSMNTIPDINIEPPSRPPSLNTRSSSDAPPPRRMGDFLSPEDAHRIRALPPDSSQEPAPPPAPPSVPEPSTTPIILPDGRLPVGFVPSSFTPAPSQGQHLPPSFETMPGGMGDAVIPDRSLFGGDADDSMSSSDQSSGLGSDDNSLTTPPQRSRSPLTSYTGTSRFTGAGVPLPASTIAGTPSQAPHSPLTSYTGVSRGAAGVPLPPSTIVGTPSQAPHSPLTSYTGVSRTAAGVPLPPSTVSGTPRSAATYLYAMPDPAGPPAPIQAVRKASSKASSARSGRSRK